MSGRPILEILKEAAGDPRDLSDMMFYEYGYKRSVEIVNEYRANMKADSSIRFWNEVERLLTVRVTPKKTKKSNPLAPSQSIFDITKTSKCIYPKPQPEPAYKPRYTGSKKRRRRSIA